MTAYFERVPTNLCRQVLKSIADACDQESLARAGGYLFRYVQEETVLRDCGQRCARG